MSVQSLIVEACWHPMVGDVAGDFHDVIDLKDGRVAIVIGDVAGVGPDAAEKADELQAELHRRFRSCLREVYRAATYLEGGRITRRARPHE